MFLHLRFYPRENKKGASRIWICICIIIKIKKKKYVGLDQGRVVDVTFRPKNNNKKEKEKRKLKRRGPTNGKGGAFSGYHARLLFQSFSIYKVKFSFSDCHPSRICSYCFFIFFLTCSIPPHPPFYPFTTLFMVLLVEVSK